MDELIERMLSVRARFAPIDRARCRRVHRCLPLDLHVFAVALHRELLQIGGKTFEVLLVRQHGDGLRSEEIVSTKAESSPMSTGTFLRKRRGAEMFVHLVETRRAFL